jgi:EXLDI family protein
MPSRVETFRVYRSRMGKYVLHVERSADYTMVDSEGKPAGWRGYLGLKWDVSYGSTPGESTLEVVGTLEELRERIPPQLYDMVAGSAQQPVVEDLDI